MNNRIRTLREQRSMTQVRLSIELEVTQETVSGYENGRHAPSYAILVRMSDLFGVSIDYLMGRSDEEGEHHAQLTSEENDLLQRYRSLCPRQQERFIAYLDGLSDRE